MLKKEIGSRPGRTVIRVFLREGKGEVNGQEAITPVPYEAGEGFCAFAFSGASGGNSFLGWNKSPGHSVY